MEQGLARSQYTNIFGVPRDNTAVAPIKHMDYIEKMMPELAEQGYSSEEELAYKYAKLKALENQGLLKDYTKLSGQRAELQRATNLKNYNKYQQKTPEKTTEQAPKAEEVSAQTTGSTPMASGMTIDDIKAFQKSKGLKVDGLIGKNTSAALKNAGYDLGGVKIVGDRIKTVAPTKGEYVKQTTPQPTMTDEEYQRRMAPVDKSSYSGVIPSQGEQGLASSGIAGYIDRQVADMARVADLNRMQKNASYADAVGKLFGY